MITGHLTSVFILGMITLVFAYDTYADAFGKRATISEVTTTTIYSSRWKMAVFFLLMGILLGHFLFSAY